jgi:hypothetical protein
VSDPGESLASGLVVALHHAERRGLVYALLDAAGRPPEEGVLKEDDDGAPLTEAQARAGVAALRRAFPREQVDHYHNALWLQDAERWAALEGSADWP